MPAKRIQEYRILFPNNNSGATISSCGKYRFRLWRIWDESKPCVYFMMHNPSIADAMIDDPTIRRCIGFAKSWEYGGIYVGNLYSYRATDPKELLNKSFDEITHIEQFEYHREMIDKCQLHVLAYGNPIHKGDFPIVFDDTWHCLKITKAGNPCHPLYLKSDLKPVKFNLLKNKFI